MVKRFYFIFIIILVSSIPLLSSEVELTDKEKEYLSKKNIHMCIDPDWMPFEKFDKNGKHIGMSADYYAIFRKKLHAKIIPVMTTTWSETLRFAKSRECDIISLSMKTPEREKYLNFTTPYLKVPIVIATKLDKPFIYDIKSLENKSVGITKGYAFVELLKKKYKNLDIVEVENIEDGLVQVNEGKLFGFIGTLASISYMFQSGLSGELKIAGRLQETWELGIGIRNDDKVLFSILQKAVDSLESKQQQEILISWISINYEKDIDYSLLIKVLIIVFIFFMAGVYHNRKLARINDKMQILQEKLLEQAHRDPMTNLYNRRFFHEVAYELLNISKREKKTMSVIMLDIDLFKKVNDVYGHSIGDDVIKKLSKIMTGDTRQSDIIARFGGEEFVILLPNTSLEGAVKIASKLKKTVENEVMQIDETKVLSFTISLGVDEILFNDDNIELSLNRADEALYEAKETGRNKVCVKSYLDKLG